LNKWDKIKEELERMYSEAKIVQDYQEIVQKRETIEKKIGEAELHEDPDKFAQVLLSGYWGEYYYWLKGFTEEERKAHEKEINNFLKKVSWFWRACKTEIAFAYGDLLSTAYDYLLEKTETSLKVFKDLKERAEKTGNRTVLLRIINRGVTREMAEKNWEKAVERANEAEALLPVRDKNELRHFGNIFNNRGAAKIRGDIDPIEGIKDLIFAANNFYLQEEMIPVKHLIGIFNRIKEGIKKIKTEK